MLELRPQIMWTVILLPIFKPPAQLILLWLEHTLSLTLWQTRLLIPPLQPEQLMLPRRLFLRLLLHQVVVVVVEEAVAAVVAEVVEEAVAAVGAVYHNTRPARHLLRLLM